MDISFSAGGTYAQSDLRGHIAAGGYTKSCRRDTIIAAVRYTWWSVVHHTGRWVHKAVGDMPPVAMRIRSPAWRFSWRLMSCSDIDCSLTF